MMNTIHNDNIITTILQYIDQKRENGAYTTKDDLAKILSELQDQSQQSRDEVAFNRLAMMKQRLASQKNVVNALSQRDEIGYETLSAEQESEYTSLLYNLLHHVSKTL